MGGFLKFLIIAICIFFLLRMVLRLVFPWAMRKAAQRIMGKAQEQYQRQAQQQARYQSQSQQQASPNYDGKVHIDYVPPKSKTKSGKKIAGEFVDFEEVKK